MPTLASPLVRFGLLVAFAVATTWAQGAAEVGPSGYTRAQLASFARALQLVVSSHNAALVAELVAFPLRVNRTNREPAFLSERQFLASFDEVFTPEVSEAVASQDPDALFENWQGAMFGRGAVWISGVCATAVCAEFSLRVVAVNVPSR